MDCSVFETWSECRSDVAEFVPSDFCHIYQIDGRNHIEIWNDDYAIYGTHVSTAFQTTPCCPNHRLDREPVLDTAFLLSMFIESRNPS